MSSEVNGPGPGQGGVEWVYSSTSSEQLVKRYDTWAVSYDAEMEQNYGWSALGVTATLVQKYVRLDGRVLDAGVGTGLVGQLLSDAGYTDLTGFDFSAEMLAQARLKNVYGDLLQMELGKPLPSEAN